MKLEFVSAGAAHALVAKIAAGNGVEVAGSFGAVGAMLEKFNAGEACDVVILTRAQIAELASRGAVVEASIAELGAAPTAIAVRAGEAAPNVSDEPSLRAMLGLCRKLGFANAPEPGDPQMRRVTLALGA